MDEEHFNMDVRKFLKKVGITSQREIEKAVREALAAGALSGNETLDAMVTLKLGGIDLEIRIEGEIGLS